MEQNIHKLRIFVASPSDVSRERDSLSGVINELNRTLRAILPDKGIILELVRWETDSHPAMGRPQQVILDQVGTYDIFIGILWKRFGTPTGKANSGTEEEFREAYQQWSNEQRPRILFYFNRTHIAPPRSSEEIHQLAKVSKFRLELNELGLFWEYEGADRFPDVVRPHLTEVVGQIIHADADTEKENKRALPINKNSYIGKIVIRDIGPDDAYHEDKEGFIGRLGEIIEHEVVYGWSQGTVRFDEEIIIEGETESTEFAFYQFKFDSIE